MIIKLVGPSGSGKSTLETALVNEFPETYKKAISSTTRPMRKGEEDGVHYFYKRKQEETSEDRLHLPVFNPKENIENVEFGENLYGVPAEQVLSEDGKDVVLVVEPHGAVQINEWCKENNIPTITIYMDIPLNIRIKNMSKGRGDDEEAMKKRLELDNIEGEFKRLGLTADQRIKKLNKNLTLQVHEYITFYKKMYL